MPQIPQHQGKTISNSNTDNSRPRLTVDPCPGTTGDMHTATTTMRPARRAVNKSRQQGRARAGKTWKVSHTEGWRNRNRHWETDLVSFKGQLHIWWGQERKRSEQYGRSKTLAKDWTQTGLTEKRDPKGDNTPVLAETEGTVMHVYGGNCNV